jgi:hypothetical protein
MDYRFEYISNLQYKVKSLSSRVRAFESGEKYVSMKEVQRKLAADKDMEIKKMKQALAEANSAAVTARENWMQIFDDMEKAHAKELQAKDRRVAQLGDRAFNAERRVNELLNERRANLKELYAVKVELEDEKDKNRKLFAQLNRNYENSSIPSSQKPNRKKIKNGREATGRKQGAQPGHKGHGRKRHEPTNVIEVKPPEEYLDTVRYYPTGKIIRKQLVNIAVSVDIDEFWAEEFRDRLTRQRVHADFPAGVVNDVNYGGSVKAFSFLLNNHCFVSIDKTREFLSQLTGGKLEISRGMINGLSKEFSNKTRKEQSYIFSKLMGGPVMGTDFTNVRVNGISAQVLICAAQHAAMYYARMHKGHDGIKGSPVEDYQGTLVHDHDRTFYSYGRLHQECLAHILRYLLASIENEPGLQWNKKMWDLIRKMIHHRNSLDDDAEVDLEKAGCFEREYLKILDAARNEYEDVPPSKYNKDGYNLYKRLYEFKDSHLLFLYDFRVPANNNLCERLLRVLKRKMKQVMTFRSFESLEYLCSCLGLLADMKQNNENLYLEVASVFS